MNKENPTDRKMIEDIKSLIGEKTAGKKGGVGIKHDFSKPQMSLLPMKDLEGVVRVLEFGAQKYARGDWAFVESGAFRYLDAGLRHLTKLSNPISIKDLRHLDPESRLPSIDHAICSLIIARHFIFKEEVVND